MHLVEEHSVVDPTYIEDFLLTYRTFLSSPMVVGKKLLEWFHDPSLRDKVRHSRTSERWPQNCLQNRYKKRMERKCVCAGDITPLAAVA